MPTANIKTVEIIFSPPLKVLNPYIIPPTPNVDNIIEKISILGFVSSDKFTIYTYPNIMQITIIGINIINSTCQLKYCNKYPDIVGPRAGPSCTAQTPTPITEPCFSGGVTIKIEFIIIGIIIPVPIACTILDISNIKTSSYNNWIYVIITTRYIYIIY